MKKETLRLLMQIADGIAVQFGSSCEVAVHDPYEMDGNTVVYVVNEHTPSQPTDSRKERTLLKRETLSELESRGRITYMLKTPDGKVLKTSAICMKNEQGEAEAILSIRYDVSKLMILEGAIRDLISTESAHRQEPEKVLNVNELLERLIQQSVELVGKPVEMMNKDDKIRAIQFLSRNGAFLVTKSGDKVAKYFGISKYTLYSYIDAKQAER